MTRYSFSQEISSASISFNVAIPFPHSSVNSITAQWTTLPKFWGLGFRVMLFLSTATKCKVPGRWHDWKEKCSAKRTLLTAKHSLQPFEQQAASYSVAPSRWEFVSEAESECSTLLHGKHVRCIAVCLHECHYTPDKFAPKYYLQNNFIFCSSEPGIAIFNIKSLFKLILAGKYL